MSEDTIEECKCCKGDICCDCGTKLTKEENYKAPDPFDQDINNDPTLHKQCSNCTEERAMEI